MRVFTIIFTILTMFLLFSTLVCGLWIGANDVDPSSIDFHRTIGIATVLASFTECILALVLCGNKRRKAAVGQ